RRAGGTAATQDAHRAGAATHRHADALVSRAKIHSAGRWSLRQPRAGAVLLAASQTIDAGEFSASAGAPVRGAAAGSQGADGPPPRARETAPAPAGRRRQRQTPALQRRL